MRKMREAVERETFNYSLKMRFANKYMKLSRNFAEKQLIFRLLCQLILLSG